MPTFETNATLESFSVSGTDHGPEIKATLTFPVNDVNANTLANKVKKGFLSLSMSWTGHEQPSLFNDDGSKVPPQPSIMSVSCTPKLSGTCHQHSTFTGAYWHCKDHQGTTFTDPCEHAITDLQPNETADVICPDCAGSGTVALIDGGDPTPTECLRCAGQGHGPTEAINAGAATAEEVDRTQIAECAACNGTGEGAKIAGTELSEPCRECNGVGHVQVAIESPPADGQSYEKPLTVMCPACQGSGEVGQGRKAKKCSTCEGEGQVLPAQGPDDDQPEPIRAAGDYVESGKCSFSFYAHSGHCFEDADGPASGLQTTEPCPAVRAAMTAEPEPVGAGAGPSDDNIPF